VWWVLGIPVASAAGALLVGADHLRNAGARAGGDALDVARLALFWFWFRLAWKCARNVRHAAWAGVARAALLAGFALSALA
jgi:hypothetical protein